MKMTIIQGNKDNAFVEERCFFLDLFIKEICKLPYLFESSEFQAFIRTPGDVEKALVGF
jgi:sorting nexin-1/2